MSNRMDIDLIEDILVCLTKIEDYIAQMSYEKFQEDPKTQDAVIRNIEIIGEASKLISKELKQNYPMIPWKAIAGTRDRLIHDYFGVNIDVVWEIATKDVPNLKQNLKRIKIELGS